MYPGGQTSGLQVITTQPSVSPVQAQAQRVSESMQVSKTTQSIRYIT